MKNTYLFLITLAVLSSCSKTSEIIPERENKADIKKGVRAVPDPDKDDVDPDPGDGIGTTDPNSHHDWQSFVEPGDGTINAVVNRAFHFATIRVSAKKNADGTITSISQKSTIKLSPNPTLYRYKYIGYQTNQTSEYIQYTIQFREETYSHVNGYWFEWDHFSKNIRIYFNSKTVEVW